MTFALACNQLESDPDYPPITLRRWLACCPSTQMAAAFALTPTVPATILVPGRTVASMQCCSMGVCRAKVFLFLCLLCSLRQANKLRALLHPLQPLQKAQLPKGAQALVADVIGALIAKGTAFGGHHGVGCLLRLQALQVRNVGQVNGSARTLL